MRLALAAWRYAARAESGDTYNSDVRRIAYKYINKEYQNETLGYLFVCLCPVAWVGAPDALAGMCSHVV